MLNQKKQIKGMIFLQFTDKAQMIDGSLEANMQQSFRGKWLNFVI